MEHAMSVAFWIKIFVSLVCGFAIGLERQSRGKSVGIRTSILVCMGTMVFIYLGTQVTEGREVARVLGQIVTGIGFLGAGVIMTREGMVSGMTSAAEIWLLAGIGSSIGLGYYDIAVLITCVALSVLLGIQKMEDSIPFLNKGAHKKQKSSDS